MTNLDLYWMSNKEWIRFEDDRIVIKDDAPEEAKASYAHYLEQLADIDRRTTRSLVIPKNTAGINYYEDNDAEWSRGSYETELLRVFNIPYEEFCIIRKELPIEEYLAEDSWRMYDEEIQRYLDLITEKELKTPQLIEVLTDALRYKTFVEYVEEHIL